MDVGLALARARACLQLVCVCVRAELVAIQMCVGLLAGGLQWGYHQYSPSLCDTPWGSV